MEPIIPLPEILWLAHLGRILESDQAPIIPIKRHISNSPANKGGIGRIFEEAGLTGGNLSISIGRDHPKYVMPSTRLS